MANNGAGALNGSGYALLIAAGPTGRQRAMDAAAALPPLGAVAPAVLLGTVGGAQVVQLVDPDEPHTVLAHLRTAAAHPGPVLVYLVGQVTLDAKQHLPHLALARTTPKTARYTALPWHWLLSELGHRPAGSTTVFADLVADETAWPKLSTTERLGTGLALYGCVAPPPPRRQLSTPHYTRALAGALRAVSVRPPLLDLHQHAVEQAGLSQDTLLLTPADGASPPADGAREAADPLSAAPSTWPPAGPAPTGEATAWPAAPAQPGPTAPPPPASVAGLPLAPGFLPAPGSPTPSEGAGPPFAPADGTPPQPSTASGHGTTAPTSGPAPAAAQPPGPAVPAPSAHQPGAPTADPAGADAPRAVPVERPDPTVDDGARPVTAPPPPAAGTAPQPPAHPTAPPPAPARPAPPDCAGTGQSAGERGEDPADAVAAAHATPGTEPRRSPDPGPPPAHAPKPARHGEATAHDPHGAILEAAHAGRHSEAAAMAAAWEQEAFRSAGPDSPQALHWLEVRADLARLAGDPARACELWMAAATTRLGAGQPVDQPDVEGAVDRAHHQWQHVDDPVRARALATELLALRGRVPGRRPGALRAIEARLESLRAARAS